MHMHICHVLTYWRWRQVILCMLVLVDQLLLRFIGMAVSFLIIFTNKLSFSLCYMLDPVSCWLTVLLNWLLEYCVVAASRGTSNSRSNSLVVLSRVEQASEPICLEYRIIVEFSPLSTHIYNP